MSQPLPPWLTWLETCDSTNTWALRHANSLYHGQVIYTRNQTHGRGQYGRQWRSGGFTASFVVTASPAIVAPSLVAGLAVVQAVESVVPSLQQQLQLKWPNDVMAQGKKLAGLLCEHHQGWLVVGVGLNLSKDELPQAISLQTLVAEATALPTELDLLMAIREELLWCWESSIDWLSAVSQRDFLRGRAIKVTEVTQQQKIAPALWQGEGAGINTKGHLQLRLAGGEVVTVASGHIIYE